VENRETQLGARDGTSGLSANQSKERKKGKNLHGKILNC
jgi:hypothetical protein